jgi:hypothetical protein
MIIEDPTKRLEKMSDREKQLLDRCPYCNTPYIFASSVLDEMDFAHVSCAECYETITYKMDWVR